jgi:hypothetical protein
MLSSKLHVLLTANVDQAFAPFQMQASWSTPATTLSLPKGSVTQGFRSPPMSHEQPRRGK